MPGGARGRTRRVARLILQIPLPESLRANTFGRTTMSLRRDDLDRQIEEVAFSDLYRPQVQKLACFRGISTLSAMTLITEIGDWRRFERPGQIMAYLGLVPSEHSSRPRNHKGSITKAGNSRCRHVLVQAAWHYRHRPAVGVQLDKRHRGQPPGVIAHAWKAQHRLYKTYHRIAHRKSSHIADELTRKPPR